MGNTECHRMGCLSVALFARVGTCHQAWSIIWFSLLSLFVQKILGHPVTAAGNDFSESFWAVRFSWHCELVKLVLQCSPQGSSWNCPSWGKRIVQTFEAIWQSVLFEQREIIEHVQSLWTRYLQWENSESATNDPNQRPGISDHEPGTKFIESATVFPGSAKQARESATKRQNQTSRISDQVCRFSSRFLSDQPHYLQK